MVAESLPPVQLPLHLPLDCVSTTREYSERRTTPLQGCSMAVLCNFCLLQLFWMAVLCESCPLCSSMLTLRQLSFFTIATVMQKGNECTHSTEISSAQTHACTHMYIYVHILISTFIHIRTTYLSAQSLGVPCPSGALHSLVGPPLDAAHIPSLVVQKNTKTATQCVLIKHVTSQVDFTKLNGN